MLYNNPQRNNLGNLKWVVWAGEYLQGSVFLSQNLKSMGGNQPNGNRIRNSYYFPFGKYSKQINLTQNVNKILGKMYKIHLIKCFNNLEILRSIFEIKANCMNTLC